MTSAFVLAAWVALAQAQAPAAPAPAAPAVATIETPDRYLGWVAVAALFPYADPAAPRYAQRGTGPSPTSRPSWRTSIATRASPPSGRRRGRPLGRASK